jgi:hypothetical protein
VPFEYGPFKQFNVPFTFSKAERVKEVGINHHPRKYGESGWTFGKLLAYHMENMVSLSQRPFQIVSFLSIIFSILLVLRVVIDYFFPFKILGEVTNGLLLNAIMVSLLMILSVVSAVGEYAIRSFIINRQYPIYVVKSELSRQ